MDTDRALNTHSGRDEAGHPAPGAHTASLRLKGGTRQVVFEQHLHESMSV